MTLDPRGRVMQVNRALARLLERRTADVAGVPVDSLAEGGVDAELSAVLAGIDKLKLGRAQDAAPGAAPDRRGVRAFPAV